MAIHIERVGLIKESLVEMIHVAKYSLEYRKEDKTLWKEFSGDGILGFPASVILFSIIDCIGSIFRGNSKFKIPIDGKDKSITNATDHIFILNSKYFNLQLTESQLRNIYNNIRSPLTHNSLLPKGYIIDLGDEKDNMPFKIQADKSENLYHIVYLIPLFKITSKATHEFINDLNAGEIDFENSKINGELKRRDLNIKTDYFKEYDIEMPNNSPE
jgi:hypothetical protein